MIWTSRIFSVILVQSLVFGKGITIRESYNELFHSYGRVHATPHITNLIRNGNQHLTQEEISRLGEIGLTNEGSRIIAQAPATLDEIYETDHFRFYYTLDNESIDKVDSLGYVIIMSQVFEQVWNFFGNTLGYDAPPGNPNNDDDKYDVYIVNLPSNYFGITYTTVDDIGFPSCVSYIKMRNSYSGSQFTEHTEIDNIKVTAVHEFFHAIQFGYNCWEQYWFMEATAVWSEDELYNDINDLYRYMPSWFLNPDKAINTESSHMYGTFIFFQYIDEHIGGPETIRSCWEKSREMPEVFIDMSYSAIDGALESQNSSFEEAYTRMRIANQILSSHENADIYTYEEAEGYLTVVSGPAIKKYLMFEKGDIESESSQTLDLYESFYYSLNTDSPVLVSLNASAGEFSLTSVVKQAGIEKWIIRSGDELNIDPAVEIEWISLIISALGEDESDWDFTLRLEDGHSDDFTFYPPYPNPSFGNEINFDLQVIQEQGIEIRIINMLGEEVWNSSLSFTEPEVVTITWNGKNIPGQHVANGIYLIVIEGENVRKVKKVTYLKKSD